MILLTLHIQKQFVYTWMSLKSELWDGGCGQVCSELQSDHYKAGYYDRRLPTERSIF